MKVIDRKAEAAKKATTSTKNATITLTEGQLAQIVAEAVAKAVAQSRPKAEAKNAPVDQAKVQPKAEAKPAKARVAKKAAQPKAEKAKAERPALKPDFTGKSGYGYCVTADTDTRDGSALWVVKVTTTLDRDAYLAENASMKALGGYYSRFKGGFVFRYDPSAALKSGKCPKGAKVAEYTTRKGERKAVR